MTLKNNKQNVIKKVDLIEILIRIERKGVTNHLLIYP